VLIGSALIRTYVVLRPTGWRRFAKAGHEHVARRGGDSKDGRGCAPLRGKLNAVVLCRDE
jgi:hypothetical protein